MRSKPGIVLPTSSHMKNFVSVVLVFAASIASHAFAATEAIVDYAQPSPLTGKVYETSSGTNKVLFTFKRTAVRSNTAVHVVRDFSNLDGSLAARETLVFQNGRLALFQLDERQTGAVGTTRVTGSKLLFTWAEKDGAKAKSETEQLKSETLVGDMIPHFIRAHWTELVRGDAVNFRFIASSRLETVGFKFVKESEVTWRGKPALRLRMEPSSVIIRQIVDPLFFIVEKDGAHRVLEYVGRTTPKLRDGSKWKDLDARTVYDW